MARFRTNWWGLVLELSSGEADNLVNNAGDFQKALAAVSPLVAGAGPIGVPLVKVIGVLALYVFLQSWQIRNANSRKRGVYLTLPWAAMAFSQWWIIVAGSR